jgi:hypothetical protein
MRILIAGLAAGLLVSCGGGGYGGGGGSNPPATLTISVDPDSITLGESATITWNSNAPCTATGAWSGSRPMSGTETVTPTETGTFTYTLVCRGDGYGSSERESDTLTVTPAQVAGLVIGEGCCNGAERFPVAGITTDSGEDRFLLLDTHYVGKVGKAQAAYATCGTCLAGELKKDPNDFRLLAVTPRTSARASIRTQQSTPALNGVEFTVPYDKSFGRSAGAAAIQGIYTTNLGTGYTLTFTVDSTGQVIGSDTNGCRLAGRFSPGRAMENQYGVKLDVSDCGRSDGLYKGRAALIFDGARNAVELFLSASNPRSAIGWRLSR